MKDSELRTRAKAMKKRNMIRSISKAISLCIISVWVISLCSCFGSLNKCEHSYSNSFRSSVKSHTPFCDKCGKEGEPLDHRFGEPVVTTPATKEKDGEGYRQCLDCGYYKRETIILCEHPSYVFVEESESTCFTFGMYSHYKCEDCGRLFDKDYNEIERNDLLKIRKNHALNLSEPEINAPGSNKSGSVRYYCDNYATCREYVSVYLPAFSDGQNYTETTTAEGTISCAIKESYLDKKFTPNIDSYVRGKIVEQVLGMSFEYSSCDDGGHTFVKDGFVNENGRLFYICQSEPLHRYEIPLPALDCGDYKVTPTVATCIRSAGNEYRLSYSAWRSVLEAHVDTVCGGDSLKLSEFADILAEGFVIFVGDGGEVDPHTHNDTSMVIRDFIPPTYDVYTNERTTGKVVAICQDCETRVEQSVEYSEGEWEVTGGYLTRRYCRTYSVFGQTVKDVKIERFKYKINLNGGEPTDAEVETEGESSEGFITVSAPSYTKKDMGIYDISVAIDGQGLTDSEKALRVDKCEGVSLNGKYTYWKIYVGGEEFPGHISIKLLWSYV